MNFKIVFTSLLFTLLFISQSFAQDVYEYATVRLLKDKGAFKENYEVLVTKKDSERFPFSIQFEDKEFKGGEDSVVLRVQKMNKEGWEVYTAIQDTYWGISTFHNIYYLRKKIVAK